MCFFFVIYILFIKFFVSPRLSHTRIVIHVLRGECCARRGAIRGGFHKTGCRRELRDMLADRFPPVSPGTTFQSAENGEKEDSCARGRTDTRRRPAAYDASLRQRNEMKLIKIFSWFFFFWREDGVIRTVFSIFIIINISYVGTNCLAREKERYDHNLDAKFLNIFNSYREWETFLKKKKKVHFFLLLNLNKFLRIKKKNTQLFGPIYICVRKNLVFGSSQREGVPSC